MKYDYPKSKQEVGQRLEALKDNGRICVDPIWGSEIHAFTQVMTGQDSFWKMMEDLGFIIRNKNEN